MNLINRYGLEALPLHLYPPWLIQEGSVIGNRLRLTPGAMNVFDGREGERPESLGFKGQFGVEDAVRRYYEEKINGHYHVDDLRLKESPQMTAAEVFERREQLQRVLGPTVGRLEGEMLDPIVETPWKMMAEAGEFGEPPAALAGAVPGTLAVDYVSPLARAQRLHDVRATMDTVGMLGPIAQARPEVLDIIDWDAVTRGTADDMGVPSQYLRSKEDVTADREARAQAQAAQVGLDAGLQIADRAAKFPETPG